MRSPEGDILRIEQTRTAADGSSLGGLTPEDPERTPASRARSAERSKRIHEALGALENSTEARSPR